MKKLLLLIFPFALLAQEGIQFRSIGWEQALQASKKENKLIFMDAYTTWCGPCKALEKYTFTDPSVGALFNASFINVRFDMEQYPGLELAEKYNVNLYPTLLFINSNGELVHRGCGALEPAELLTLGTTAINPEETLLALSKKYDGGDRSIEFLEQYLNGLSIACQDVDRFLKIFFSGVSDEMLSDYGNWYVLKEYVWDIHSREFQYLLKNQAEFHDKQDKSKVQDKIYDSFMKAYYDLAEAGDFALFGVKSISYMVGQNEFDRKKAVLDFMNFGLGQLTEDWELYSSAAVSFIRYEKEDPSLLLDISWKFYLFVDDKEKLLNALNWTKYVLENEDPDPSTIDTYASLLYKMGRKEDAIKFEQQALQLAESWGEDTQHFEFQLAKFKK